MRKLCFILLAIFCCSGASGQIEQYLTLTPLAAKTVSSCCNFTIIGDRLYCYNGHALLSSKLISNCPSYFEPDLEMQLIDKEMNYVIRHPVSGNLYYTKKDRKGFSTLYEYLSDGKKMRSVPVKVADSKISIEHPTFTRDGSIMVFSGKGKSGKSSDLWYCVCRNGKWGTPHNMGKRINTPAEEISPVIMDDFLIFATNGRTDTYPGFNLCATRLIATTQEGDTVSMIPIGKSPVTLLPAPINTARDETEIAFLPARDAGIWLSQDTTGQQLCLFSGNPLGVLMVGRAIDSEERPVGNVLVELWENGYLKARQYTDTAGRYSIYAKADTQYELRFTRSNYFRTSLMITTTRENEETLICTLDNSILMSRLPLGEAQIYSNLYQQGTAIGLSQNDQRLLNPILQFVRDNPDLKVLVELKSNVTPDPHFNQMLTARRLQALSSFFSRELAGCGSISYTNCNSDPEEVPDLEEGTILKITFME